MSEFQCRFGHVLGVGQFICPMDGTGVYFMDGLNPQEAAEILEVDDAEEEE